MELTLSFFLGLNNVRVCQLELQEGVGTKIDFSEINVPLNFLNICILTTSTSLLPGINFIIMTAAQFAERTTRVGPKPQILIEYCSSGQFKVA